MKADGSKLDISGKNNCYSSMFSGCTSLTTAPELPATTLASGCYYGMFYNCRNLTSIDISFTDWDTPPGATSDWFRGVGDSGTFTCPTELPDTRGEGYIPNGWTIVKKMTNMHM